MANIFIKKTMASMLDMPMDQVESILNAASAFKSNEINRELATKVFDKLSKKKPADINKVLKLIDEQF